jgi:1,4-alpha-glucan branching enzyme
MTRYTAWLVRKHRHARGRQGSALDQLIVESLLLQSSDWAFILKTGTAAAYAKARIRAHVHRIFRLGHLVDTGIVEADDAMFVDDLRRRDNFLLSLGEDVLRLPFDP